MDFNPIEQQVILVLSNTNSEYTFYRNKYIQYRQNGQTPEEANDVLAQHYENRLDRLQRSVREPVLNAVLYAGLGEISWLDVIEHLTRDIELELE